jgi:hypothetical protein
LQHPMRIPGIDVGRARARPIKFRFNKLNSA